MVILKKLKASTLMETLVATVLIVVIFMVASFAMNNLFGLAIKKNTKAVKTQLTQLEYLYRNNQLQLPYTASKNDWIYTIEKIKTHEKSLIEFEASNPKTNQKLTTTYVETH